MAKEKSQGKYSLRNEFNISMANLEVLREVPRMMVYQEWRNKLRRLVFEFIVMEVKDGRKIKV